MVASLTGSQRILLVTDTRSPVSSPHQQRAQETGCSCLRFSGGQSIHLSPAMATDALGACGACRCAYFSDFTSSSRSEDWPRVFTSSQSSESGKSIITLCWNVDSHQPCPNGISYYLPLGRSKRCFPGTPRCVRCMIVGIEDCRYHPVMKRGSGTTLGMGQACVSCRSVAASSLPEGTRETDTFSCSRSGGGRW